MSGTYIMNDIFEREGEEIQFVMKDRFIQNIFIHKRMREMKREREREKKGNDFIHSRKSNKKYEIVCLLLVQGLPPPTPFTIELNGSVLHFQFLSQGK